MVQDSKRRHELRLIYLRIVKRNYGEMSSRELTNRQQVALSLMHCVNCASDDADHPLVEWVAMVQELRQPRVHTALAQLYLDGEAKGDSVGVDGAGGGTGSLLRWVMRALIGRNHIQHAAFMLICYIAAHEAAMKELERIFGE